MKKIVLIISIAFFGINTTNAQWWGNSEKVKGDGNVVTKTRSISDYDKIKVNGSLKVNLVAGKEDKITIKSDKNLMQYIVTEQEGDLLKIYVKKGYYLRPSSGIKISVPFEDISMVALYGSGNITGKDMIKTEDLDVILSGSGDISLAVTTKDLSGVISGSGDIELNGKSEYFEGKVSGSGDFEAFDLTTKNMKALISGSGEIEITATESVEAKISGSGDVTYKGNAIIKSKKIAGSGSVTSL